MAFKQEGDYYIIERVISNETIDEILELRGLKRTEENITKVVEAFSSYLDNLEETAHVSFSDYCDMVVE